MIAAPRTIESRDVPLVLQPGDVLARYPDLDRMWFVVAHTFARTAAAAPILTAYALFRSLADDGAAFADDALAAAARCAVRVDAHTAAAAALGRMRARSAEHRAMRDAVAATIGSHDAGLASWFAGPAAIARAVLAHCGDDEGRTLTYGANAALVAAYAPERSWSFSVPGAGFTADRRYARGTFRRAIVADPCDVPTRDALLTALFALGVEEADVVELAGNAHVAAGFVGDVVAGGLAVPGWPVLNSTSLWGLARGAFAPSGGGMLVDIVRWRR